ncbi:MAG TPA: OsmC family protein [Thermodesulfovibrionia bacterium]|nr:OsmC family protein [Thermodesulfovibrionia bacterium]
MSVNAKITLVDGMQFAGTANSGHEVIMDAAPEVGGQNKGSRPMELVAIALGGCTGMDVISILRKKKQDVKGFEINVTGQKAEEYPKRYTSMHIEFVIKGKDISEDAVQRAVELSYDKYCAVGGTIKPGAQVTHSYRIEEV